MRGAKFNLGDRFPVIQAKTVDNTMYNPSLFFEKKIFYSFFRFTGCPACNLYFNQIQTKKREFQARNIIFVALFEVGLDVLQEVFPNDGKDYWGVFVADPRGKYYDQCAIERSTVKLNLGVLDKQYHTAMREGKANMIEGLNSRHMADASGRKNRMPAQFLVDERGKVLLSYYSKNISDRVSVSDILNV